MPIPVWQPGTLYQPGAIVLPRTAPGNATVALTNPGFESNGTGWTTSGATASYSSLHPYAGSKSLTFYTSDGDPTVSYEALNDTAPAATDGAVVTASAAIKLATQGVASGRVVLVWYNGASAEISRSYAPLLQRPTDNDGDYVISTVNAVAPVGTASVKCGFVGEVGDGGDVRLDAMSMTFLQDGLMYKAVQPTAGTSDDVEPAWPSVLGVTVVDNTVTWEAIVLSRLIWQAAPIAVSGATEPTWPTTPGERVVNGSIAFECITRVVEDEKNPRTKVVAIMAGKVFAADGDIVRFSATANPKDWSAQQDAGYLPTGLQQANANDMAVLAPYRSNLAALNASSFQNWQVDPDPASMAILDQMDGIGSTWPKAAVPVANDLFYLSQLGVRTIGIAAGAENLAAGDVGMPIDPLVRDAIVAATGNNTKALATYYPSAGQYWLAFADYPPAVLSVTGNLPDALEKGEAIASYSYTASGGALPYTFSIAAGTLPPGLSLSSTGVLTGTPTAVGAYTWTVRVTDALGDTADVVDSTEVLELWVPTTSAFFIGGIRKLVEAYSGAAIRVRRVSDGVEQDIGFSGRTLDTATLALFAGAGSVEVVKIYKQAGTAIDPDFVCADLTKRPLIVSAGTYLGHMQFLSTGSVMSLSNNGAANGGPSGGWVGMTVCTRLGVPAGVAGRYVFSKSNSNGPYNYPAFGSFGWMTDDASNITVTMFDAGNSARNKYPLASIADGTKISAVWDTAETAPDQVKLYQAGTVPAETFVTSMASPYIQPAIHYIGGNAGTQQSPCEVHLQSICIYEAALSPTVRESVEAAL